ncbi:MAG: 4a-hydroxytetrahydrobiopterin dehydratase [Verrucomicrobiales bacterium]|nr:4a-hydroxytetrahydrobiopterin dehydratase [Verrucomicrobiales bacterium]
MSILNAAELRAAAAGVPEWKRVKRVLVRTFEFEDFAGSMRFVNGVARAAEKAGHHPDIEIRWNRVTLSLTTHDAGGLTALDYSLARSADRLAARPR